MADRYRVVAAGMTARVRGVPSDGWGAPAPCEGWVARDVVDHLVAWLPAFYCGSFQVPSPDLPSVGDDPVAAWSALDAFLQASIDDPVTASSAGSSPLGDTFARAFHAAVSDVLVHTWDLARATGQELTVNPAVVAAGHEFMDRMGDTGQKMGAFGPQGLQNIKTKGDTGKRKSAKERAEDRKKKKKKR